MNIRIFMYCSFIAFMTLNACSDNKKMVAPDRLANSTNGKNDYANDKQTKSGSSPSAQDGNTIPVVRENGKRIQLTNVDQNQLLSNITLSTAYDSLKYLKDDCQNLFCHLGGAKKYKSSKNGKFILEYDPISTINTISNPLGDKLGAVKIEANNPEFSIETMPLEEEPGLLLIDALKGVSKYVARGPELKSSWQIDWGSEYYLHSYHITKGNEFIAFKSNYNNQTAGFDKYDLSNGSLIESQSFPYSIFETKYIYDEDLLLKYDKEKVVVFDLSRDNIQYEVKANGIINLIDAARNGDSIVGLFSDNDGLYKFSINQNKATSSKIELGQKFSISKLDANGEWLSVYYFLTNTPGVYSNDTKLLSHGILLFNNNNNNSQAFHMNYQSIDDFISIKSIDNSISISANEKAYKMDLTLLNNLKK